MSKEKLVTEEDLKRIRKSKDPEFKKRAEDAVETRKPKPPKKG